jgi:hypothetical protein
MVPSAPLNLSDAAPYVFNYRLGGALALSYVGDRCKRIWDPSKEKILPYYHSSILLALAQELLCSGKDYGSVTVCLCQGIFYLYALKPFIIYKWFFQVLPSCGSVRRWGGGERFRFRPQKILELDTVRDSLVKELEFSLISRSCPCSNFIFHLYICMTARELYRRNTGAEAGECPRQNS